MRFLVISTVRNEASFLLEWIAYHQHIGVTDFLIYTNDCEDGTDQMLDRLAALGHVVHERSHSKGKKPVQWRALNKADRHSLKAQADWVYVADIDEFLNIHAGDGKIVDLLAAAPSATGFAIPWRMFGNGGVQSFVDVPVMEQFTDAAPEALIWPWRAVQYKSIFANNNNSLNLGVHRPRSEGHADQLNWVDGNGQPHRATSASYQFNRGPRYGLAQINHYALGSTESFLVKKERGKPNHNTEDFDLSYWVDRNFCTDRDRSILRHQDAIKARTQAFLTDPILAELHERSVTWRKKRIRMLLERAEYVNFFATLLQSGPTTPLPPDTQEYLLNQLVLARRREIQTGNGSRGNSAMA